jgi:hypothetical protein
MIRFLNQGCCSRPHSMDVPVRPFHWSWLLSAELVQVRTRTDFSGYGMRGGLSLPKRRLSGTWEPELRCERRSHKWKNHEGESTET